jgi:S1-C subfamily serine protease
VNTPARPRVTRETRLLLSIALISVAVLWGLARLRFPDRLPTPNPVPPVLTQLGFRSALEDVAAAVSDLRPRVAASLFAVEAPAQSPERNGYPVAALRFREDLAVVLLDEATAGLADGVFRNTTIEGHDPASGLAVIRVPGADAPALTMWEPRRLESPRYVIAGDVSREGIALRPVFLGALYAVASPTWEQSTIWAVPHATNLEPGTFLFTVEGALVGLVTKREGRPMIVPGHTVMARADRLLSEGRKHEGRIGIEVQALSPAVASVTGATTGVVVTWVAPEGPAAGQLQVADVIEATGDQAIETLEHWQARVGRLAQGDALVLRVRRDFKIREVSLTAGPAIIPTSAGLGLTMRAVRGTGTEILRVAPGSAAARAGLVSGDVITLVSGTDAPTPAQVSRTFATAPPDKPFLVAITRDGTGHVLVLTNR